MAEVGVRKWIIVITVILSSTIELIDTTIVNVSLPQMMGNLGATLDEIAWVVTAYIFANVIVVPMASWFSAVFGRRNYFAGSILLFTVASFFCGHATSLWELVFFRFVQGAGGGALMATSQSILVESFPPEELGFASGLFGLGVVVGPTIGPTLGGWITDNYSWPWIFYVNLPIGALAFLLTATFIRDPHEKRKVGRVDWWGILLLVLGVGSLQIVLDRGERDDWFNANYILVLTIIAAIGIALFIWRELTTEHPVVDLRVMKNRQLAVGTLFTFVLGFVLFGSVFVFPVFVQNLLGFTAMQTGLIMLPSSLTTAFMMPLVGRLIRRGVPPLPTVALGFLIFFSFTWTLSQSTLASGQGDFFWPLILRGLGLSMLFVPFTTLALSTLRGAEIHQGTGLTNMMRQLGGSLGVAIIATFIEHRAWAHRQDLLRYVTPYDFPLRERMHMIIHGMVAHGSTFVEAQRQALAAIEGTVSRQAFLLTYMDAFRVIGVFLLCCMPLLLLFKRGSAAAPPVTPH
jgi:MFS transporter, DHA2 family, multidrug resistance protein